MGTELHLTKGVGPDKKIILFFENTYAILFTKRKLGVFIMVRRINNKMGSNYYRLAGFLCFAYLILHNPICFGQQNMANLQAAFHAKKLIVIEDSPIEERDFTQGIASQSYEKLVQQPHVTVQTTTAFLDEI